MPQVKIIFYQEASGIVPVLEWLKQVHRRDKRIVAKLQVRIEELQEQGWELKRPSADYLRDGIYELRVRFQRVNYRILYSFHDGQLAMLAHGITKENEVPDREINIAIDRYQSFKDDPKRHTYERGIPEGNGQKEQENA